MPVTTRARKRPAAQQLVSSLNGATGKPYRACIQADITGTDNVETALSDSMA
jgi:predicted extracellular nuclease